LVNALLKQESDVRMFAPLVFNALDLNKE